MEPLKVRTTGVAANGIALLALACCCIPALTALHADPPSGPKSPPAPSLMLITIDTWRWDHIGISGAGRVETPNLDRLAKGGVYEREAVSPCPLTTPAHASILTGLDPMGHGVLDCTRYALDPSVPTLAEAFGAAGFATAAFVSSETLKARFGLKRGFDLYDDAGMTRRDKGDWAAPTRDGREATEALLRYLPTLAAGRKAFVWLHYFDLHLPYRPRPDLDRKYPGRSYAAQAAFVDGEIGRVLEALRGDAGRAWRIVVVGDHGEGLGEKGEDTHGIGLYRATLHVPLILFPRPDKAIQQGKPWGLVDLAPTIREWFGLPATSGTDGLSLFQKDRRGRPLFAVSAEPSLLFGVEPALGVRQGPLLYLRGGGEELYDQEADPAQDSDLSKSAEHRADLERLRGLCDRTWPPGWPMEFVPPQLRPSLEELKNLQSLGYAAGPSTSGGTLQRVPVRQVMKDKSDWDRAREAAFLAGRSDDLIVFYRGLLPKYPNSYALRNWFGPLLGRAGLFAEAIAVLRPAASIYPKDGTALLNMGAISMSRGRPEMARKFLEAAAEREPDNPLIHKELGVLYAEHLVDPEKAVAHYRKYLELGGDADAQKIQDYIRAQEQSPKKAP